MSEAMKRPRAGKKMRKVGEARASKILREMKKREPCNIEYCDLKQRSEREELEELLGVARCKERSRG